jgi:POT family proton-dependent oligopeptide transporter
MSTSLFALRNVDLEFNLPGAQLFDWSPARFQALNAIRIMVLSPVLAWARPRCA